MGNQTIRDAGAPPAVTCAGCGQTFALKNPGQLGAHRAGRAVYCGTRCRGRAYHRVYTERAAAVKQYGPCPTCGQKFGSKYKKKYCSLKCYTSSPDVLRRLEKYNREKKIPPTACPNCGVDTPRKKKYCSDRCRREFFAARFDRWIANPEQVALPQNYDEFLLKQELPCPVEGCDWCGHNLSFHANTVHGVPASDFKALLGFNQTSGLISAPLHVKLSEVHKEMYESGGKPQIVPFLQDHAKKGCVPPPHRYPVSIEAKEHWQKAYAVFCASAPLKLKLCCGCGRAAVRQPPIGRKKYCSVACRTEFYRKKKKNELRPV